MQPNARRWIYIALAYFCTAVSIGCWMGATQQFAFAPLHAHINLLGWVTMTLTGLIYHHFPAAANNRLAQIHFWGYNALVPVMMVSLGLLLAGHREVEPLLGMTSVATLSLIVLFAINVWRNGATAADGLSARPAAAAADAPPA
jgi:cbb3-type cytochrome oxidase subunit 1